MRAALVRLLTVGLVAAGLTVVVAPATPAHAAACPRGTGITVAVNSDVRCDRTAGGYARSHFMDVGHDFEDARRFPGFICRINGFPAPAQDRCIDASPADAYWSLWWSDGSSGRWVYSQLGVNSLTVPEGGWVAFRWNVGGGQQQPPVSPVSAARPSSGGSGSSGSASGGGSAESSGGSSTGTAQGGSSGGSGSGATTAEEKREKAEKRERAEKKREKEKAEKEEAEARAEAPPSTEATTDAVQGQSAETAQGSLGWVAIVAIMLVLGAGGGLVAWRRRPGRNPS